MGAVKKRDGQGVYYEKAISPIESIILRKSQRNTHAYVRFNTEASASTYPKSLPPLRYGFYEGGGTSYRLEPRDLVRVLYDP